MAERTGKRVKLTALIVVGEGACDMAFLNHMKSLYDNRTTGQRVNISSADGGSPGDIIDTAIRRYCHMEFDKRYVLLDSDVPVTQQDRDKAGKHKINLIESTPHCLEGMLLEILGKPVPDSNRACKDALHPKLAGRPTDPKAYSGLFTRQVLDETEKEQIVTLRHAISNTQSKTERSTR